MIDKWVTFQALIVLFPKLFNLYIKKNDAITTFFQSSNWNLHLRCNLRNPEIDELSSLLGLLSPFHRDPLKSDSISWALLSNGIFSVSSFLLCSFFSFSFPSPFPHKTIWYPIISPKVQGFLGKLLAVEPLLKTNFSGSTHIFLHLSKCTFCVLPTLNPTITSFFIAFFSWQLWGHTFSSN